MRLEDVDLTVTEYFSKRTGAQNTGAASPRHKLNSYGIKIGFSRRTTVHPSSCRPDFHKDVVLTGLETRAINQGRRPLIISGNKDEIQEKEMWSQSMDTEYCDCCGLRIQRMPRQIVEQVGGLCPRCSEMMNAIYTHRAVEGPWTILYGPESASRSVDEHVEMI